MSPTAESFIQQLTASQSMLHAYISSLVLDPGAAGDILQETNLVLWRRSAEFVDGTSFGSWSRKVAYFQVLAHYRDRKRERQKLTFDADLVEQLAADAESLMADHDQRRQQLRICLAKLSPADRDLIDRRYGPSGSVQDIARELGRSVGAVSQSLYRIRQLLQDCIRTGLAAAEGH